MPRRAVVWLAAGTVAVGCVVAATLAVGGAAAEVTSGGAPRPAAGEADAGSRAPSDADDASAAEGQRAADLSAVADRLRRMGPGFAGLRVDEGTRRITAHWAGRVPREAAAYAESRPLGATIVLVADAAYTRAELLAAADRVTRSTAGRDAGVTWAAPDGEDGSGLTVGVEGSAPGAAAAARLARIAGLPAEDIRYETDSGLTNLDGVR
ncbi:hypothetical protein AB0M28_37755 [Streptomyces sp. NPDC051940]|uniref:hypothetical protein n=1 Tax=Streptomyces sp. NPDC051940 TaxID=3155675 RepID=UPI00342AB7EB